MKIQPICLEDLSGVISEDIQLYIQEISALVRDVGFQDLNSLHTTNLRMGLQNLLSTTRGGKEMSLRSGLSITQLKVQCVLNIVE